jgi:hypothetical protein
MILYHYTSRKAVSGILLDGLNRGEAPMSETRVARAVNLTTDRDPSGHGLDMGGHVVTEQEAALYALKGHRIPAGTVFLNKREVRITLKLPSSDTNLKQWRPWSRKHCEPGYADILEAAAGGGQKVKTWWLYFGTIPTTRFLAMHVFTADGQVEQIDPAAWVDIPA